MNIKGVLKRLLPFAATFAVAVFITSFFVDLNRPRFRFRGERGGWHEMNRLRTENDQLKNENLRLRNELENRHFDPMQDLDMAVPPPPTAPIAPRAK
jgi:hypothetical protein